jgi:prepilin peptidase CpaA
MIFSFSNFGVLVALWFLVIILTFAAYFDLKERRIPNQVILVGLAGAATLAASGGLPTLGAAALGLIVTLVLLSPIYFLGLLGAGDIKLIALIGGFFGLQQIFPVVLFIALAGGLLSLTYLSLSRLGLVESRVPYAVAIFSGVIAHLLFQSS